MTAGQAPTNTPPAPQVTQRDADQFLTSLTSVERLALFGVLIAQIHDIHAMAYNMGSEEIAATESLCAVYATRPGPLAEVTYLSAAVSAFEIDHPLLTDAQTDAGLLLAGLDEEFGPVFPA